MARKLLRDDPSWQRIEHWLPGKQGNAGRSASDNRLSVEAVCWIACTGAPWRNLPPDLEPWSSMHKHFSRWEARGRAYSRSSRKDADFKALSLATLVRAHQHAAGAAKNGSQALGRSRGGLSTKIHALVEGLGQRARWSLRPGQTHDITEAGGTD